MGIPLSTFQTGDAYIDYAFEDVLFRYEKATGRYFAKLYGRSDEHEIQHDDRLFNESLSTAVLTTAERYLSEGVPSPEPADSFSRMAVKHQRTRPCWLSVMHLGKVTLSGTIEVGADGRLEVVQAVPSVKEHLEKAVAGINAQPSLKVTYRGGAPLSVDRGSKDYDFALRLELKKWDLEVYGESSYYHGRGPA